MCRYIYIHKHIYEVNDSSLPGPWVEVTGRKKAAVESTAELVTRAGGEGDAEKTAASQAPPLITPIWR